MSSPAHSSRLDTYLGKFEQSNTRKIYPAKAQRREVSENLNGAHLLRAGILRLPNSHFKKLNVAIPKIGHGPLISEAGGCYAGAAQVATS